MMTYKDNITSILECNFSGFKKEIIDNACDCILRLKCNDRMTKKDSINDVLDKIGREIDRQEKWLYHSGYTACNIDIVFSVIKSKIAESRDNNE